MNMTTIREKSKIFLWICLSGFILSLLGVMGTSGGSFLGGSSLTSFFSTSINTNQYVGRVDDKKITINEFYREVSNQRNTNQFQINATESFYIGRAWDAIITNTVTDKKINELNLNSQNEELKNYLMNTPPVALQNFLKNNNLFKIEDDTEGGSFNLEEYQNAISSGFSWLPDSLLPVMANYENILKNDFLPKEKLRNLYNKLTSTSKQDAANNLINSKTNCNIDVLSFNYNDISDDLINITEDEIYNYYNENINDYKNNESITVEYVLFENITDEDDSLEVIYNEEQREKSINFSMDAQPEIMTFKEALDTYEITSDTIKITEDFTNNSGIPIDLGYDRRIVRFAFDNNSGNVSDRFATNKGNAIFHVLEKNDEFNTSLEEATQEITKILIGDKKKELAISYINEMINSNLTLNDMHKKYDTISSINKNEEGLLNGTFKTTGKNYKVMGALSAMQDGDVSNIIDAGQTFYLIKLNKKDEIEASSLTDDDIQSEKKRIETIQSRTIYNGWIKYTTKTTETVDLRYKSI
tara:strand:+ start:2644 stop:4227 length:1584 start_codon:yes stop_codon:yes gene_type:complete